MKKIFISLLMVAASLNAMAVAYTGKAKLTLTSEDNKSCYMIIGESEDLNAGLNSGYYAVLNEEGKEVQLYAEFGGVKYQQFASNAATMADLQLGIKTNASANYTLTASNVTGALKIRINGVEYTITEGMSEAIVLPASSVLPAAGDEDKYKIQPSAPIAPSICFNYGILEINGHADESLVVKTKEGATELVNIPALPATYSVNIDEKVAKDTYVVVTLNGQDYQIKANPTVTPAN